MSILTFLSENSTPIIAVAGTLLGVIVTHIFSLLRTRTDFKNLLKMKRFDLAVEFEKRNLIEPVLLFLESDLRLTTRMYAKGLEIEESKIDERLSEHILDMSMASARVMTYGDEALTAKFEEFTRKRLEVGFRAMNQELKDMRVAHENLNEAQSLASEIISLLKDRLSRIGS